MMPAENGLSILLVDDEEEILLGFSLILLNVGFPRVETIGFCSANDRLPEFFEKELPPHNAVWDFTGAEIDQFWNF